MPTIEQVEHVEIVGRVPWALRVMQTRSRDHNHGGTSARPMSTAPSTRPSIFVVRPNGQNIGSRGRTAWVDIASQRSTEAVGPKLAGSSQALSSGESNSV